MAAEPQTADAFLPFHFRGGNSTFFSSLFTTYCRELRKSARSQQSTCQCRYSSVKCSIISSFFFVPSLCLYFPRVCVCVCGFNCVPEEEEEEEEEKGQKISSGNISDDCLLLTVIQQSIAFPPCSVAAAILASSVLIRLNL